jgi:hypothetical protein
VTRNYTVIIDQTTSRFDVWTVGDKIVAINYLGTTTTRTTSIMPFPCDGVYDKEDILNQRLEFYNYKDGSGGIPVTADYIFPPSCESFNFLPDGSLWQVAMVKNINFRVLGVSPSGIEILHVLSFPQAVYFGTPTNVKVGNTNITAGIAANTSARVLQQSMQEVIDKYGGTDVSDLILDQYFRERLIHNYPLFVPGGRVNFNSTSNIPATNYKTNAWTAGNCN